MSRMTVDDVTRMVRALVSLHDETGRILDEYGHDPSPGSQAADELSEFSKPEFVKAAYAQANMLIEGDADHLTAFVKTVTEPVQTVAPWTCVRAAIECGAHASWLLDPSLDVRTRVQRSFAFRYKGLAEQVKFARASNDSAGVDNASMRIDKVEQDALQLDFPRVLNRNGERIGIAQQMPSVTEVIKIALDEEATYRLLSAMIHAHHWAIQQLSFRQIDEGATTLVEKNLRPESVAFLCVKVAHAFANPLRLKLQLFGWPVEGVESILASTFASLGDERVSQ
jgi:hypothetical protein